MHRFFYGMDCRVRYLSTDKRYSRLRLTRSYIRRSALVCDILYRAGMARSYLLKPVPRWQIMLGKTLGGATVVQGVLRGSDIDLQKR